MLILILRPWAMYGWAPLALIGEEINKLENSAGLEMSSIVTAEGYVELSRASLDSIHAAPTGVPPAQSERTSDDSGAMAGVYLGIWNIFATIPQFIATFIAMVAFSILEPGKSPELADGGKTGDAGSSKKAIPQGLSGTALCLAIGAICSFVAATQSFRLRRYQN